MKTILLSGLLAFCAAAQTPMLIRLTRTPGTAPGSIRAYSDAGAAVNVLGMISMTGVPETWLVETHYSFGSIEDLDKALNSVSPVANAIVRPEYTPDDPLAASRTLIAVFRPGWGYQSGEAMKMLPVARYFRVSIYRMGPGSDAEFLELARLRRTTLDKTTVNRPDLAYEVISGAPSGTYLLLAPLTSLRMIDAGLAQRPVSAESSDTGRRTAASAEFSLEHLLFRVEPRISFVSDDFASADPDFWRPKQR
jgi:hypothetical protein